MSLQPAYCGLFWFFSLAVALFALTVMLLAATVGFAEVAPHLVHYLAAHNVPLYAHVLFGPLALLLMPFQFWAGLRNRYRLVHRILGYAYVVSIAVASLGALLLLSGFQGSAWAAVGFALLAILWVATTARALFLARAGRTGAHRAWMMRSAALTFAAVTLRLMMLPLMAAGMSFNGTYDITAWASWLIPLAFVEWKLRRGSGARLLRSSAV
jgi:uncharacterized membrane protein